jgi:TonB family protein
MLRRTLTAFFVLCFGLTCFAQTAEHPGVKLYRERKYAEARAALSSAVKEQAHERDALLWNLIGLTYVVEGNFKDARKPLENAVAIDGGVGAYHSNLAFVHLSLGQTKKAREEADKALAIDAKDVQAVSTRGMASLRDGKLDDAERDARAAIALDDKHPDGYVLHSQVLIGRLGKDLPGGVSAKELAAVEEGKLAVEAALTKCRGGGCENLKDALEGLAAFVTFAKDPAEHFLSSLRDAPRPVPPPGVMPVKILSKPRPNYTDAARTSNTQGTIRIAVLFRKDGYLGQMILLNRLGKGLDEEALKAARKIAFEPMKVNGQPVSTVRAIEYSFSIY